MADQRGDYVGIEPATWFLIFYTTAPRRWLRWLAMGRFKHVSALGWLPDQRCWVHYEVGLHRTRVGVMPAGPGADKEITRLREGSVVLAMPPAPERRPWARLGFWCVPAMAHLVGIPSQPLRPDALFAACVRRGGEIVDW